MRGPLLLGPLLLPCLASCSAAPAPAATVTMTARLPTPSAEAGDSAPWDLHAVCAAASEIETTSTWWQQQTEAKRLTAAQSHAVLQSIAVQDPGLGGGRTDALPAAVAQDVDTLVAAAGSLDHPSIDLDAPAVRRAQQRITDTCQANGLTVGVLAQGG